MPAMSSSLLLCGKSWNWAEATWNDCHLKWKIEWYLFMAMHESQKFSQQNNITLIMLSNMDNFLVRWGGFLVFRRHRLRWFMIFASLAAADIVVMWCCLYAMGRKKFLGLSLFFIQLNNHNVKTSFKEETKNRYLCETWKFLKFPTFIFTKLIWTR